MVFAKRVVMLVISLGYLAAQRALALFGRKDHCRRVVLTYHIVTEGEVPRFDRQMQQLRKYATPVFADEPETAGPRLSAAVTFDDAFENVISRTLPILARHGIPVTIFVPTGYLGVRAGWIRAESTGMDARVVSVDLLKNLDPRLARLGSHTVTHPRLAGVTALHLNAELASSKQTLEAITGQRIRSVALPYGSCSPEVIRVARGVGYDRVFANVPVRTHAPGSCELIGRVDTSARDWRVEFYLKLQGAYEWMAVAVPIKRAILNLLKRRGRP